MNKDWFAGFLPFWAWGTTLWMAVGFFLMPEAFRRPLFVDRHDIWVQSFYDVTDIDGEIALKLALIMGLPLLLVTLALIVAAIQQHRARRRAQAGTAPV